MDCSAILSMPRFLEIMAIGLALAMDAFAVSVASGIAIKNMRIHHAVTIAGWFGGFQALMPVLGWLIGCTARQWVAGVDHWVVFALLAFLGCKMIYEAFRIREVEEPANPLKPVVLLSLAVATSIDALGVGVSFAMLGTAILLPAVMIGAVTFLVCFAGVYVGERGRHLFESKIEVVGGLILIGIGVKVLLDHLL